MLRLTSHRWTRTGPHSTTHAAEARPHSSGGGGVQDLQCAQTARARGGDVSEVTQHRGDVTGEDRRVEHLVESKDLVLRLLEHVQNESRGVDPKDDAVEGARARRAREQ